MFSWTLEENSQDAAAYLLQQRWQDNIVDFDNHLDNVALDWRNKPTNSAIDKYSSQ